MPREMREHVPARETAPSTPAQASAQPNRPDVERWVASQNAQSWGIAPSQPQTPQLASAGPGAPGGGAITGAVGGGGAGWGGWERERFEPAKERWATGAWVPERPVNAFGIPQMTMRCLEVNAFAFHNPFTVKLIIASFLARGKRDVNGRTCLVRKAT